MSEARARPRAAALEVRVSADPVALTADWLVERIRERAADSDASKDRAEVRLAIPGGSALATAERAAAALGEIWGRVALTWVDERCVPVASPESNRGEAMRRGLLPCAPGVTAARACAHPPARALPLFEDGEAPERAVARVEKRYAVEFGGGLDVVLLGMGEDGHVASLFPGALEPKPAVAAFVSDSPKPPAHRITLTRRTLASAAHVLLFAAGESKRSALQRLCAGDPKLPATALPGLVVVTDLRLESANAPPPLRGEREKRGNG